MHAFLPHARTTAPPPLTGDLDADTAAAIEWLYAHPQLWLEDEGAAPLPGDGRTAA